MIGRASVRDRASPMHPAPDEPPAFTAAIALQIAAGSRPSDPRWDGSVTSLDALMILQAAAHAIDL